MTQRSIRRAAERRAKKLEKKNLNALAVAPVAPAIDDPEARVEPRPEPLIKPQTASTGPRTPEGKAKSCLNAVKTALTGRTVLLPTDDAVDYQNHTLAYQEEFQPVGMLERNLVQAIADSDWRLSRIRVLEMALFAKGRLEFASLFDAQELSTRPHLIDAHTFITYERQLRNLQLQEARLSRRRDKEAAELRRLQEERAKRLREQLAEAARLYQAAKETGKSFDLAAHGFVFSTQEIERYLERVRAAQATREAAKQQFMTRSQAA
jgi:hypothetical protein